MSFYRPYSLSMYANAMEHLEKLDLGKNEMMLLNFDNYQVVHFNHYPLVLTLIGSENVMAGQLIDLSKQLEPLIQESVSIVKILDWKDAQSNPN